MSKKCSDSSSGEGNTVSSPPPSIRWVFTLNNYSKEEYEELKTFCSSECKAFIIGKEIGEKGTPHLQGYIEHKKKIRLSGLKKINGRCHWEKAKGNQLQNIEYCSKDGDFETSGLKIKKPVKTLKESQLYNWQLDIIKIIKEEPDDRTIYWYWEPKGCAGKTTFCKYLSIKYEAIPIEGKKNDILYCAAEYESNIYLMDIERSMEDYISYGAIEKIKNGYFMCSKYESKPIIRNCPHIFIFANFMPDTSKLSRDRWCIKDISK